MNEPSLKYFLEIPLYSIFSPKRTTNLQKFATKNKTKNIVD
jgi:hypothetical protein